MADDKKLDVLAIAAHRDDVEITCGGTIIKLADMGRKVGVVDLTEGEMGTMGTSEDREKESIDAAEIMGLAWRGNLGMPDAMIEVNIENKLSIARVIRKFKPELVILPYWIQRHPDHLAASQLGYDACYLSGLKKLKLDGDPHRPRKIIYTSSFRDVKHSFFVDISDQLERKLNAVRAYRSQFEGKSGVNQIYKPGVDLFEFIETTARQYGYLVDVKYAEAFTVKENILIEDPQNMLVKSI